MAGLGIDFGSLNEPVAAPAASMGKSTRRHAHLARPVTSGRATSDNDAPARLPCAPLRENRAVTNTLPPVPQQVPAMPMQHLLPPKPTACALSPTLDGVQHAQLVVRAETPSEQNSPRSDVSAYMTQKSSTPLALSHARNATPFLPASLGTFHEPRTAPELPSKPQTTPMLPLERDRRVGIEIFLEEDRAVEGGCLQGCIRLRLPAHTSPKTAMLLAQPRVRLIGYETLPGEDVRHVFYHHASVIDGDRSIDGPSEPYVLHGSPALSQPQGSTQPLLPCCASLPDADGFYLGKEGTHVLPFTLQLPIARGAKGSYRSEQAEIGYIAIASVRVRSFGEHQGGIAHCFQKMDLYPYLNPTEVLASATRPILEQASDAQVRLAAALHRETWVAGQRVYFDMSVLNRAAETMHLLHVSLQCTETLHRSRSDASDDYSVSHTTRTLWKQTLNANGDNAGHWWAGVHPGPPAHFGHSIVLPGDALTIEKSRHIDVRYTLRIGVGTGNEPRVAVELPLRIVHFVSLDPPPVKRSFAGVNLLDYTMGLQPDQGQMVERVRSMDALRSPRAFMSASGHLLPSPAAQPPAREVPSERTAQHRRSLDFINSAIRSATARRSSPYVPSISETPPAGLGIELGTQPQTQVRPRASWYKSQRDVRRPTDASFDTDATQDTSLQLGDETNDDVVLVFDPPPAKTPSTTRMADTTADTDGGSTLCHDILDAYGNQSQDESTPEPMRCSAPMRGAPAPRDDASEPRTPTRRPSAAAHAASVPRETRPRNNTFMFATSASPLKVKAAPVGGVRAGSRVPEHTLARARSTTALATGPARVARAIPAEGRAAVVRTPERPATRTGTAQNDAIAGGTLRARASVVSLSASDTR